MIINAINFGLKKLLQTVQDYGRYDSWTKQSLSLFDNLFISTFINTSFVITLVYANIFDFIPMRFVNFIIPGIFDSFTNNLDNFPKDFNRLWYQSVGSKIQLFTFIQAFFPHIFIVMFLPMRQYLNLKMMGKVFLQRDLNELMIGDSFDLTMKYSRLLGVIFICFIYSSGMPSLLITATFTLFTQYLTDKYLILRYCRKPFLYDESLHKDVMNKISLVIIIHLVFGIYSFGCPEIFPDEVGIFVFDSFSESPNLSSSHDSLFWEILRRLKKSCPLSFLFLYVLIYSFTKLTILNLLQKAKKVLKNNKIIDLFSVKTINEAKKKLFHDLDSYDIRKNPIYLPLIEELESFKIIQTNETSRNIAGKRFCERQSTMRQTSPNLQSEKAEFFYESYWDLNNHQEIHKNLDEPISDKIETIDEHKIFTDDLPKTSSKTNELISNQFLKNNEEEQQNTEEKTTKRDDPKIMEFLGESQSQNFDPSSRNSFNSHLEQSPLRGFSLLKHSLLHNIYKTNPNPILKIHPVPVENDQIENQTKDEVKMNEELFKSDASSRKFNRMFESQEKKINEIRKLTSVNLNTIMNISQVSSKIISNSNLGSPEKKSTLFDKMTENDSILGEFKPKNSYVSNTDHKNHISLNISHRSIVNGPEIINRMASNDQPIERFSLFKNSFSSVVTNPRSQNHSISPARSENRVSNTNNLGFKEYLKKYDKRELFQCNSSSDIQNFGREAILSKKRELPPHEHNSSLNLSLESFNESPTNFQKIGSHMVRNKSFKFLKNADNIIIPIEEMKKLEDIQTPKINKQEQLIGNHSRVSKTNRLNQLEEGSRMFKDLLKQIKHEIQDEPMKDKPRLSDSIEFAVVPNKKGRSSLEDKEDNVGIFRVKKK